MSRVYRALEKAEKEKRKRDQISIPKPFEEKLIATEGMPPLKRETQILESPPLLGEEGKGWDLVSLTPSATEEFRKLKTQIFHRLPDPPCTLLITSAIPGEGKTTVAFNLAKTISFEIHKKALLIDCDLRKPTTLFNGVSQAKGLSDYLSGNVSLSEILLDSGTANLRIIHSGPTKPNSTELIGSKKMEELVSFLKAKEDSTYILIDSSPVISTSEPLLLSKIVDGILLVIQADRTSRETVQRAIRLIDAKKIIGIVLNQVNLKPMGYYSKYYDHYYRK